ncbi:MULTISPECIES: DUF3307 domain-containing protein [Pseudoalteromonas]|uniref:DUF3307 domain-containing protein n=1 Tax=Pseudoalteromonas TaxID=53246 RepID=UPI00023154A1|nr:MULTISPECIES: DUF3307 domain-containing protein [unclassified Pseudoalteromonas]ALQ07713.1 hypothetical protein D172_006295 [Pseudoalteromonas sp. Bsw20308]ATG78057.1 hypothetical protein AOR04_11270 [Pseudoalteromonas sp. 1_2015MBL_MicDiv]KDC51437.1 hypothetical protein DO88_16155 [Pseudoalteromonas sp. S3431]GAA81532.1 hypothetical protein P20495_4071 [Pseudoalteromonas sp. BSi20495]
MSSFTLLLTALILGHLLADFYWQPMSWVHDRNKHHFRAKKLYVHAVIHGLTSLTVLTMWEYTYGWQEFARVFLATLTIMLTHYFIDLAKSYSNKGVVPFLVDQITHLIVILVLVVWLADKNEFYVLMWQELVAIDTLIFICSYLLVLKPSSLLIGLILDKITGNFKASRKSIAKSGHYLGLLERVLILSFILIGEYSGIGFLIAAKSIFRFGDLKHNEGKGQSEYVMLGTLLSVIVTLFIGVTTLYFIKLI